MIDPKLYNLWIKFICEARETRTIDRKLWLSVASTCSRNKSTEAENVKPLNRLSKEDLLHRYVAAIIIMKKPCPNSLDDINTNKTFKFIGLKLIELGCSFDEIKNEYIANGGKLYSEPLNVLPNVEQLKLETEIKQSEVKKDSPVVTAQQKKPATIKTLPPNVKSYDDILSYVKTNFNTLQELSLEVYKILDTTYYTINRSFYKKDFGNLKVYFRDVYTSEEDKLYANNQLSIYVTYVVIQKKKVYENTFCFIVNNTTIGGVKMLKNKLFILSPEDNISVILTYDDFYEAFTLMLSKLLYANLVKFANPYMQTDKVVKSHYGTFGNKKNSFSKKPDKNIINKIADALETKMSVAELKNSLYTIFCKYKLGNMSNSTDFYIDEPICSDYLTHVALREEKGSYGKKYVITKILNTKSLKFNVYGINFRGYIHISYVDPERGTIKNNNIDNDTYTERGVLLVPLSYWDKGFPYYIDQKKIRRIAYLCYACILYYANNYDNLIK